MRLVSKLALSLSALLVCSASALAEPAKSEKQARGAVEFRQSLFQLIRSNMGPLGAMAKGNIPFDTAVMAKNGMRLEQLGLMLPDYLAVDTRGFNVETEALDKVWAQHDDFNEKIKALISASQALQAVANAGDESKFRSAIGAVGRSCKGCHDNYKAE